MLMVCFMTLEVDMIETCPEVEAAWEQEADRREAELASGAVAEIPGHEAMARLQARITR
jgi:hypothetical protein